MVAGALELARAHPAPDLEGLCRRVRQLALAAIYCAGSGHPGGSLSCVEILAALFGIGFLRGPAGDDPDRDRFVLSKGHACPALYALGAATGLLAERDLAGLRRLGSPLQGHPHVGDLPWVETSTGSLGQGFSVALGMALGVRHLGGRGRVAVLLGDGELQEGQVWEAAQAAAHHRVGRLLAVVDFNGLQSDDHHSRVCNLEPLADRWRAFGWCVREVEGHDLGALAAAFELPEGTEAPPTVVLARTVKGRGVSFMEGSPPWHGSVQLADEELRQALLELAAPSEEIERWLAHDR